MKKICTIIIILFLGYGVYPQSLEVEGEAKVTTMRRTTTTDLNVVQLSNGNLAVRKYLVGDFAQGGIVFYVDETGEHGLVCTKSDIDTLRWYAGTTGETQSKGNGPFSGEMNTSIIISSQVAIGDDGNSYAARACSELIITERGITYGDWYLPSKDELLLMFENKARIDDAAVDNGGTIFSTLLKYWSSTEISSSSAYRVRIDNGVAASELKFESNLVRAVRAF